MINKPITTAHVMVNNKSFSNKSIKGKVTAGTFQWDFTWAFGKGELMIVPPLGRALIQDSLERFLVKTDYKLEAGGDYIFTVRAKF